MRRSAAAHTFPVPAAHGHPERRPEFDAIHFFDDTAVPITFCAAVGAPDDTPNWRADGAPDIGADARAVAVPLNITSSIPPRVL